MMENAIDRPISFTARQILSWVLAGSLTLSSLAYAAGTYNTKFTAMETEQREMKAAIIDLTNEVRSLSIELKEYRIVNKR